MAEDDGDLQATVVVPTFRRPAPLRRALESLAGQGALVRWDLVVVDNDDPPGAASVFDACVGSLGVPARLVREQRRGASHARNRGISEVRAPITVFLDDDVVPQPGWLDHLVAPLLAERADAVAGRVVLDPDALRPPRFSASWHDPPVGAYDRGA
ncbi:MAG: putative glycosyltransferase, partial [Acidimicrobiales bacterium]|nr:putative glycosyltransferase [Acidimicrobiales bacterium]